MVKHSPVFCRSTPRLEAAPRHYLLVPARAIQPKDPVTHMQLPVVPPVPCGNLAIQPSSNEWRTLERHETLTIPDQNRLLVESALHEDVLDRLIKELGSRWSQHHNWVMGRLMADRGVARERIELITIQTMGGVSRSGSSQGGVRLAPFRYTVWLQISGCEANVKFRTGASGRIHVPRDRSDCLPVDEEPAE